jgi:hypothetical protein
VKAAAEEDRQSRTKAEARVAARGDREAALEKLGDLYLQFAASPEGTRFLEMQHAELCQPRNDPEYLKALEGRDKDREAVANEVTAICHAVVWGKNRIGLCLKNDRDHAKAREVASKLQGLLEAELLYSPDPHDPSQFADRAQKQPPKHEFGRERGGSGRRRKPASPPPRSVGKR